MLVHSVLSRSAANGPGERAVVWFQGCDLRCPGCWNQPTHAFDSRRARSVKEVGDWIRSCRGVEGVTFSGGEPFQQAPDLYLLCEYIKSKQPGLSIGVFTGYTLHELVHERWHWRRADTDCWVKGSATLFEQIKQFLDFAVFGRFRRTMACSDKPLCGSRNQEVVFFSDRYSEQDLEPQSYEVHIDAQGLMAVTGFPPQHV